MATLATQRMRSVYFNRTRSSFIDSALLSLTVIIPLLFFVALIVTGTLLISSNYITHQPLPHHFTLGISLTFSSLMILGVILLFWFLKRRFNKKRAAINANLEPNQTGQSTRVVRTRSQSRGSAPRQDSMAINADLEANRPRQSPRVVRTRSQSRGRAPHQESAAYNADLEANIPRRSAPLVRTRSPSRGRAPRQDSAAINTDLEANRPRQSTRVVRTRSQSRGRTPRLEIPRRVSPVVDAVPIEPEPAYMPWTPKLPFTAANYEVNRGFPQPPLSSQPPRAHSAPPVIPKPTRTCSRRDSKRIVGTKSPRKHGPPPTKDHSAFHLPVLEAPVLYPNATRK